MPVHFEGEVRINKINMGPYDNNGYIVICPETNEGIIIDTPAEPEKLLNEIGDVKIGHILITHNHFDHLVTIDTVSPVAEWRTAYVERHVIRRSESPWAASEDGSRLDALRLETTTN